MFCLDTNVVIAALNERTHAVAARFDAELAAGTPLMLPTIVLFELRYGIAKSVQRERSAAILARFLEIPLTIAAFEAEDTEHAGDISAHLARAGTPIGPYDLLIAAQTRRRDATLVTTNIREFARAPGLNVADWTA